MASAPNPIFSRDARRLRRDRLARCGHREFDDHVADLLLDRIGDFESAFSAALVVNTGFGRLADRLVSAGTEVIETDHGRQFAARRSAMLCDEDALPAGHGNFDLVVIAGGIDRLDDVPGALVLARRALAPGGRFITAFPGAPGFPALRALLTGVDARFDAARPRFHPLIDVRAGGDLLVRAGFKQPVADVDSVTLRYATFDRALRDIRDAGLGNVLQTRGPVGRAWREAANAAFVAGCDADGRFADTVSLIVLTGMAPHP